MRISASFLLMFLAACSCVSITPKSEQAAVAEMLDSTVRMEIKITSTLSVKHCDEKKEKCVELEIPLVNGQTGSGVIYGKVRGKDGSINTRILTAHHVLETPEVGSTAETPLGLLRVDSILMTVKFRDGTVCEFQPLALGESNTRDTATGVALCDAGRVASIASAGNIVPVGARVVGTAHPAGIPIAVAIDGYVSGTLDGYVVTSVGAVGGSSGGPIWYNGKVIGLLVKVADDFHHVSLVTPLQSVLERIAETK